MNKYKIRVLHQDYGCESGCCGHVVEITDSKNKTEQSSFTFSHPYGEDFKLWATQMATDIIKDEFPECFNSIDWDTLEYKDVSDN